MRRPHRPAVFSAGEAAPVLLPPAAVGAQPPLGEVRRRADRACVEKLAHDTVRIARRRLAPQSPTMKAPQFRQLLGFAEERDRMRAEWLRFLLLLTSGSLSLLVSLRADRNVGTGIVALWSLRAAWTGFGLSILALAVTLHEQLRAADRRVNDLAGLSEEDYSAGVPRALPRTETAKWSERIAYAALAGTVAALVCHGLALTW